MAGALTTNVPSVLDPWLPWLRAHSAETERVLGPWLPTLASAVGPVAERREPDLAGEPTGWSGLANRGPYDRLLISEWLLADELPEEFLRRATAGEHLFVELDHSRPHRSPWTVLLCDTGPDQLGGPRLLHLALLVVLASRRSAPERLAVGSLQGTELLEPALEPLTGRRLSQTHTRRIATRADAARWTGVLRGQGDGEPPEVWIAGGKEAAGLPYGRSNRVVVEEDWRNGELLVAVHRTDGAVVRVELPAPPLGAGRVLRDPFARRRDPLRPDADHVSATYAHSRWLFLRVRRDGQDMLEAIASPKVSRKATKRVAWQIRRGESLIGAGRYRRRAVSLWADDDTLIADGLDEPERHLPRPAAFRLDRSAPLEPVHASANTMVVADAAGEVWQLDFDLQRAIPLAARVGASWLLAEGMVWSDGNDLHRWSRGSRRVDPAAITPVTPAVRMQALGRVGQELRPVSVSWTGARDEGEEVSLAPWADRVRFLALFRGPSGGSHRFVVGVLDNTLVQLELDRLPDRPGPGSEDPSGAEREPVPFPEPILTACPDPEGMCWAVVTPTHVRFLSPHDLAILASWEIR